MSNPPSRHLAISLAMQAIGQCLPRGALASGWLASVWSPTSPFAPEVCRRSKPMSQLSRHPPSCMHVPLSPSWTSVICPLIRLFEEAWRRAGRRQAGGMRAVISWVRLEGAFILPQAGASTMWCRDYAPIVPASMPKWWDLSHLR